METYPDTDIVYEPAEAKTTTEADPTEMHAWLGHNILSTSVTEAEIPTEPTSQPPKPLPERYPYHLEEGLEKKIMQFGQVLVEAAADVLLPFDVPHSELTGGEDADAHRPVSAFEQVWFGDSTNRS